MDSTVVSALIGIGAAVVAALGTYLWLRSASTGVVRGAEQQAQRLLSDAEAEQRQHEIAAQEEAIRYRQEAEDELREQRRETSRVERRLEQREDAIERRAESLERGEQSALDRQDHIEQREAEQTQALTDSRG